MIIIYRIRILFLTIFAFLLHSMFLFGSTIDAKAEKQQVQNLYTFTKLYGYVRYFHPSDEASNIDFDKLAIYGSGKIKGIKNSRKLKKVLEELFLPIAPTLQIFPSTGKPVAMKLPDEKNNLAVVSWQHKGLGTGGKSLYKSVRLNRPNLVSDLTPSPGFGTVTQGIEAKKYRGKKIKLQASVKTDVEGTGNQGQLWLRVDRPNKQMGFFDNMADRPITYREWKEYEIIGTVAKDAEHIVFGCFLNGHGKVWMDNVQLLVQNEKNGRWIPAKIKNPEFKNANNDDTPKDWFAASPDYKYKIIRKDRYKNNKILLIERKINMAVGKKLFYKKASIGEVVQKRIGSGLSCYLPLALYSDTNGTLPRVSQSSFEELKTKLRNIKTTVDNENTRLAAIIIAWNVMKHFYPYFDVVDVNWEKELPKTLQKVLDADSVEEFKRIFDRLIAQLQDGHAAASYRKRKTEAWLPLAFDWVEQQVVITTSDGVPNVHPGDIIINIDGVEAKKVISNLELLISGSPQWKRRKALEKLGAGNTGSFANLEIKRGKKIFNIKLARNSTFPVFEKNNHTNIEELTNNIYYVNLTRLSIKEYNDHVKLLANARGVIFDMRGYPNNHNIIKHLIDSPVKSAKWNVPHIIYPDQEKVVGFGTSGRWNLRPEMPCINGHAVFLIDARAISYAESVMGIVEHYKLGEIVGSPTAGANGNVNSVNLPGMLSVRWTGMKVLKHDDSQHHLIGILPTVHMERTIKGVTEGWDEFLEKAILLIEKH
jgi:C-terminal processing protease CtpA/Prc